MKRIFFFLTFFYAFSSLAQTCIDSDGGKTINISGKIVYSLTSSQCLGENCYSQFLKDFDRCLENNSLLEYYCEDSLPKQLEIKCPEGSYCSNGRCRN